MEELLNYIEAGSLDNAELLRLFAQIKPGIGITTSMQANTRTRDTHIRYHVWKLLPASEQAKYTQQLVLQSEIKAEVPEKITEKKPESPTTPEAPKVPPTISPDNSDEIRRISNQANKLANTLKNFAAHDDAGRAEVMAQISTSENQIKALRQNTANVPASEDLKFVKAQSEIDAMTPEGLVVYKQQLSQQKSRAKTKLEEKPEHKFAPKWQKVYDEADRIFNYITTRQNAQT